ncbi:MAG: D-2-hydroxyacid dehydrogenase [Salinirussus sp.]
MPRVLLSHEFPPETRGTLEDLATELRERLPDLELRRAHDFDESVRLAADAEVIIEHGLYDEHLAAADELEWVQSLSSGADRYDVETLRNRGIVLTTVSGVHAKPIAEQILTYLLAFERNLPRGIRQQERREWRRYPAGELGGSVVGVIGVGAIGGRFAELATAIGVRVLGVRKHPDRDHHAVDQMYGPDRLNHVLGRADYAVLACPLTDATRGLIGEPELSSLGNNGILVNVARGAVVEQQALVRAIQTGDIRGAALDVFDTEPLPPDSPLWQQSNVIVTPHMAGGSPKFPIRCAELIAENYRHFIAGERDLMRNRVL